MALVNKPIPSLIGGVSQQPSSLRHPSQVEAMENCVPSVAVGVRKRTGTQHIAKLDTRSNMQDAFVHAINRGTNGITERYFVVADQGDLKVYDFRGVQQTVNFPHGKTYLTTFPDGSIARDIFRAVTVADYTFFVNTTIKAGTLGSSPAQDSHYTYAVIKAGVANTTYYIALDGVSYSFSTNSTNYQSKDAAEGLKTAINGGGTFTAERFDNVIRIHRNDNSASYTFGYTDGYGNQAGFMFRDTVNRYEELPRIFVDDGTVFKIKGEPSGSDSTQGAWYVRWKKSTVNADGVWVETVAPNVVVQLDAATMPYILRRETDGTWTFLRETWSDRLVGDDISNPLPSFIGSTINDIVFHRNRLGFLADENLILSQAGSYFNFWATTARAVVDSDQIDVSASTNKVTILRHAVSFNKQLLLFSDKMQFVFGSEGTTLKPGSAKLDPATQFETSATCRPVSLGTNVYFPVPRGQFTGIREYYVDTNTISNDAADVTAHVPSFVPGGVFRMCTAPTEDMVFALTANDRSKAYVYNTYWDGEKKAQSAWHYWQFDLNEKLVAIDTFGSTLTLVIARPDGLYLDMMELEERPYTPAPYTVCLDRWIGHNGGTYSAANNATTWTLPFADAAGQFVMIVLDKQGQIGQGVLCSRPAANMVSVKGDYSGRTVVIGKKYLSRVRLSEIFNRDQKDDSIIAGRLQLRDIDVAFSRTGYFRVQITPNQRDLQVFQFPNRPLGLSGFRIGQQLVTDGKTRFSVMSKSDQVLIELVNDSHLPSIFQALEWTGVFTMQARRQ